MSQEKVTPQMVWEFLMAMSKELDKRFKETDLKIRETQEELRKLIEKGKETEEKMRETDEKIRETQEGIRKLENLFTTQWGKLIEALVEPGTVNLFRGRGIGVRRSIRRMKVEDEEGRVLAEYDILLENDQEVVVIEVKTTVKKEDVDELIEKLEEFKKVNPKYREYKVYGGIAGIEFSEGSDRYAYKKGLFVLKSQGGMIEIANDPKFEPKTW